MQRRKLTINAIASSGQVVASAAITFLFYRVLLQHISVAEVGLWALIVGSVAIARLTEFGLGTGVVRYVAQDLGAGNPAMATRTVTMGALGVFVFIATAALIGYPVALHFISGAVPSQLEEEARALLLLALGALVVGSVSNAFVSALDGLQHMGTRAAIQIAGNILQLAGAIALVPRYGVVSLGWIQLGQAAAMLVANIVATFVLMKRPAVEYLGWDGARFRELLTYGGSIQLAAIGQMLFEPVVKIMLTSFSGLTLVGYFEMANRVTQQFRTILVSGYNAMVPYVATQVGAGDPRERTAESYIFASRLLLAVSFAYFAVIACLLPLVLYIWADEVDSTFLLVALIMWVGWSLNTLAGPAYFTSLAVGQLRWIIMSQATIGVLNVALGLIGNWLAGGIGVLCGTAAALAIGSVTMPLAFMAHNRISADSILDGWVLPGVALWALAGIVSWVAGTTLEGPGPWLLAPALALLAAGVIVLLNPIVRELVRQFVVHLRSSRTG